jgi:uncharacterized delta-60 repeat protein
MLTTDHARAASGTVLAAIPRPQTEWNNTYGGTQSDRAYSVHHTSDGGYIMAGYTYSLGAGANDFWLVKTDSSGDQQWNRTYGGPDADVAYSVQQTSDGGYIVAGYTDSFGAGYDDAWLVKTDSSGQQQWNKTYGGLMGDGAHSIQQTSDGGYIMAGYTMPFGISDFWLVKTNSSGNEQWNRRYGGADYDGAQSVQQASDGGYIMAGYTHSYGDGLSSLLLVKTNSSGNEKWSKAYRGIGYGEASSVRQTLDGGYIVGGSTYPSGSGDFWLVKTDSSGYIEWNKTYGGTGYEQAYSVEQTSDGGFILAGYTTPSGSDQADFWLVKTDSSGNQEWNQTYGGAMNDLAYSVEQTPDGQFIVAGYTESFGAGDSDFWLVKTAEVTPPSSVSDLAAGSPTSDSITLTWTAPGDNGMKDNATGYVVKYSATGCITADNWSSATIYEQSWAPAMNGTMETHIVTGLAPGTKYWFAVQAYDDVNNYGGVSNSPSATTTAIGPSTPSITMVGGVAVAAVSIVIVAVLFMKKRSPG